MPVYNKAAYLMASIESVLSQTFADFELICVDDRSTDDSLQILESLQYSRIRIVRMPENSGVSIARNAGVAAASANIIAFLDADDLWRPSHLEEILSMVVSYPDCVIYSTSYAVVRQSHTCGIFSVGARHQRLDLKGYLERSCGGEFIRTSSIAVRKEVFLACGQFPPGLRNGEDVDTWLRLILIGDLAYSQELTVVYNLGIPGQATKNAKKEKPRQLETLINVYATRGGAEQKAIVRFFSFYVMFHYNLGRFSHADLSEYVARLRVAGAGIKSFNQRLIYLLKIKHKIFMRFRRSGFPVYIQNQIKWCGICVKQVNLESIFR